MDRRYNKTYELNIGARLTLIFNYLGGKRGHKGGRKQFTDPQALQRQKDKEEKEKEWRRKRGEDVDDSDEEDSGSEESSGDEAGAKGGAAARPSGRGGAKKQEESSSEEETSSEEDEEARGKGVEKLIDIENPNRVQKKHKKVRARCISC